MPTKDEILERMFEMIRKGSTCVLATASPDGEPHASLMAYLAGQDAKSVYMATSRDTRKFRNLTENPVASLLIRDDDRQSALTLYCEVETVKDQDEEVRIKTRLAAERPGISKLMELPDVSVLKFSIKTLLLLEGPVSAEHRTL